jgi:hypothetical protein
MHLPPLNDEFIGMVEYITKSFYDLLREILRGLLTPTLAGGAIIPHASASW